MEIRFNQATIIQSAAKPPVITFEIIDPILEESDAHIRLNFNTSIPLASSLVLLGTSFLASSETKLPFYFNANSPAISLQNLINYHPQFNNFNTSVESTHILNLFAKPESKHLLLETETISESPAIESVSIINNGEAINPYYLPQNKLVINYRTGTTYSEGGNWLTEQRVKAQKIYPLNPSGIHPISTNINFDKVQYSRVPKEGLERLAFQSLQLTAYLQEENGLLNRLGVSDPIMFLPNIPEEIDSNSILPTPSQVGIPLNKFESKVLIEGSPALPLYFIIPEQSDRFINPAVDISLKIKSLQGETVINTDLISIGNANSPGLYVYWLQASDFSNPQTQIKVSVEAGTQVLFQGCDWEFSLQPNTSETITLGFLNPFGLPSFLHIPIANELDNKGKRSYISAPMGLDNHVITQWQNSPEKWMVRRGLETANTISSITYLTSTDNLLTLTLETDGK
jgi:hypothetical protein